MDETISFGSYLRQRRREYGYTQEELAELAGCSPASIRKIEAGERRPSRQVAELIAECLEIPADERPTFLRLARAEPPAAAQRPDGPGIKGHGSGAGSVVPPGPTYAPRPPATNLPVSLTPLIGRDSAIHALRERLLSPDVRLLTL